MAKKDLVAYAAGCVMGVWVMFAVVGALTKDYTGFQITTPVMVIFAAWVFWRQDTSNGNGGKK